MKRFIVETEDKCDAENISNLLYLGGNSGDKPDFIPKVKADVFEVRETNERADGTPRMTTKQRDKLWSMCGNYNVPFREDDYHVLKNGWIEQWVGGYLHDGRPMPGFAEKKKTIFVGVSPEGESHT